MDDVIVYAKINVKVDTMMGFDSQSELLCYEVGICNIGWLPAMEV